MRRIRILLVMLLLVGGGIGLLIWLPEVIKKNNKATKIKTETPIKMDVINKSVITGTLVPCKEVALKPEISGIIEKIYVSIGDIVTPGTAIARIQVCPTASTIETAKKRLHVAQIAQKEAEKKYERRKRLFQQKMLSQEQYDQTVKDWELACTEVVYAQKDLDFVLTGHLEDVQHASNIVRSTIVGIVSELPCKEGTSVAERSNLKDGSTIATISDMSAVLFQGEVGEMDVDYLHQSMHCDISLLAVKGKKFPAVLTKIAPRATKVEDKGKSDQSVRFAVEGTVQISEKDRSHIRAGYTAMADIVLEKAVNVLAVQEQYVHTEDAPVSTLSKKMQEEDACYFVWVYENNKKVKRFVDLGISDGIYVEIKQGLTTEDQVIIADDSN